MHLKANQANNSSRHASIHRRNQPATLCIQANGLKTVSNEDDNDPIANPHSIGDCLPTACRSARPFRT